MNRREMFQAIAAVAASGGAARASTVDDTAKIALAIFECDHSLSSQAVKNLAASWEKLTVGTPLEGVKAVFVDGGMRLTLIADDGRVVNREIEP